MKLFKEDLRVGLAGNASTKVIDLGIEIMP